MRASMFFVTLLTLVLPVLAGEFPNSFLYHADPSLASLASSRVQRVLVPGARRAMVPFTARANPL
jgi:hypothetical protein